MGRGTFVVSCPSYISSSLGWEVEPEICGPNRVDHILKSLPYSQPHDNKHGSIWRLVKFYHSQSYTLCNTLNVLLKHPICPKSRLVRNHLRLFSKLEGTERPCSKKGSRMERPPKWKELREPHTHTYKTGKVVVGVLLVWLDKNESDRSRVRWVRLSLSLSM